MTTVVQALLQVPVLFISLVLLMLLFVIAVASKERGRDVIFFVKGVVVTLVFAVLTFISLGVPRYFSYLKIDLMQLGVYEIFFLVAVFAYLVMSRSVADGGNVNPLKVPYPVKQVVLFLAMFAYVMYMNTGLEMYLLVVGVLPVNVIYHLYYIRILQKVFSKAMGVFRTVEEKESLW